MGALQNLVPFGLVCTVKIRDFIESSKCHTLPRSHGAAGPLGLLLVETVLEIEECRGMGRACGRSTRSQRGARPNTNSPIGGSRGP